MPKFKTVISVLFFIVSSFCCKAQDGNKYVYQDSSIKLADSAAVTSVVSNDDTAVYTPAETSNTTAFADTVLLLNNLVLSADSIQVLKNAKEFAYAKNLDSLLKNAKEKIKEDEKQEDRTQKSDWLEKLLSSTFTTMLLWVSAGFFIAFVLFRLFFVEGSFFKGSIKRNKVNELAEEEAEMHLQDYDRLIAQAIANKDYRLSVRYLYLRTLQRLAENELIKLEDEKTNYQYVHELSNTPYRDRFATLTLNYEYVWYGEFELSEQAFTSLKNNFDQFNNQLQKK